MRFIGSQLQQVLLSRDRFWSTLCWIFVGVSSGFMHISSSLICVQHIAGVAMPDMTSALSGPTCWEAASIF